MQNRFQNQISDQTNHNALIRAHLLHKKKDYEGALNCLNTLLHTNPDNQEARALYQQIRQARDAAQAETKEKEEDLRGWRYQLGLESTLGRIRWALVSGGLLIFSLYIFLHAMSEGSHLGYATQVTSIIHGRYGSETPYTRPIYMDLIFAGIGAVGCVFALVTLWYVSRGAADWEELNSYNDPGGNRTIGF